MSYTRFFAISKPYEVIHVILLRSNGRQSISADKRLGKVVMTSSNDLSSRLWFGNLEELIILLLLIMGFFIYP